MRVSTTPPELWSNQCVVGEFTSKTAEEAWAFLEDVTEKSMQWETLREPERHTPTQGIHVLSGTYETEAKMTTILKRLETLERKESTNSMSVSQVSPICALCKASGHVFEEC